MPGTLFIYGVMCLTSVGNSGINYCCQNWTHDSLGRRYNRSPLDSLTALLLVNTVHEDWRGQNVSVRRKRDDAAMYQARNGGGNQMAN